ncbi:IMPACT family protein [Flagellimonas flava]|uniref:IMPACT family protein n=1 Tax=Flagellimonas flava TaxID=570519 RepID=UPI003D65CDA5
MEVDSFRTLENPTPEILYKDRKSKFFGFAFPISAEEEVKPIVEALRKKYPAANHVCYAWQLGAQQATYRANDDGEPNNSAGMPIYGQIQSFGVTNVLVAIVRIFGGTKLGVGGLIQAYRTAAQMTLENATIIEKIVKQHFQLRFDYPQMDVVMRAIKQRNLEIISQKMEMDCALVVAVRKKEAEDVLGTFQQLHQIKVDVLD